MEPCQRIVLVIGAEESIGRGMARELGRADVAVIVAGRSARKAEYLASALAVEGARIDGAPFDLINVGALQRTADWIQDTHGWLDTLVIADPIFPPAPQCLPGLFTRSDARQFNAMAPLLVLLPLLKRSRSGRVVDLSVASTSHEGGEETTDPMAALLHGTSIESLQVKMNTIDRTAALVANASRQVLSGQLSSKQ